MKTIFLKKLINLLKLTVLCLIQALIFFHPVINPYGTATAFSFPAEKCSCSQLGKENDTTLSLGNVCPRELTVRS